MGEQNPEDCPRLETEAGRGLWAVREIRPEPGREGPVQTRALRTSPGKVRVSAGRSSAAEMGKAVGSLDGRLGHLL